MNSHIFTVKNDDVVEIGTMSHSGNIHAYLYKEFSPIYGASIEIGVWSYQDFKIDSSVDEMGYLRRIVKMVKEMFKSDVKTTMRTYGIGRTHYDPSAYTKICRRISNTPCISRPTRSIGSPAFVTVLTQGVPMDQPTDKIYRRGPTRYGHSMLYA
tara:strand:+ start:42036 stop:42500 length:465 start_codon:yes stop_codon:yes gene_type:complete